MERVEKNPILLNKGNKKRIVISRLKRKLLKHTWLVRGAIALSFVTIVFVVFVIIGQIIKYYGFPNYFGLARNFIFAPINKVDSYRGSTNILILGKKGEGHDAPELTDTIIFASISHDQASVNLISLPRDIWIKDLRAKLNSAYYWGNQRQEGGGLILAKSVVEEIIGIPVHYGIVIDFSGFKKIIDVLGGIEIEVETAFVDKKYPIDGKEDDDCDGDEELKCRYETVKFGKGIQTMDGETALKFVRSRNAEGDEGSDLARAKRQEKIISAVKKKLLSPSVIVSPKKIKELFLLAKKSSETDINSEVGAILIRRMFKARNNFKADIVPQDLLLNPPKSYLYDNLYVFIPKGDSWDSIHNWVSQILY